MTGARIGMYQVLSPLGHGVMGTVYLAEHALLGRRFALKVLLPSFSRDHDIVRRFFNEARAVASISDPGIVQIFDFGFHTDGCAYIVMELLEGEPLDARLRRHGQLSPLDAVRLIRQGTDSLAAVHAGGIIHRNLKPENLFTVGDAAITGGERLKILDFGIAKLATDDAATSRTRMGLLIGTPIYMSPEQCRAAGDIDIRSDIYALGCVLFALLTGRPPFLHESQGELIAAHLFEPPPSVTELVPAVPRKLDDVVQRCLAKAPADRYSSMQALGHALDLVTATTLAIGSSRSARHQTPRTAPNAAPTPRSAEGESLAAAVLAPARRRRRRRVATAASFVALALGAALLRGSAIGRSVTAALHVDLAPASSSPPTLSPAGGTPASASIDERAARGRMPSGAALDAGTDAGADGVRESSDASPAHREPARPDAVRSDAARSDSARSDSHRADSRPDSGRPPRVHRSRPRPAQAPTPSEPPRDDRVHDEPHAGSDMPPPISPSLDFTH